jgi:hypothetical protein
MPIGPATLPLSLGALVGVLLSGGFVWWEVGRYATPQVPVTLFDERRELFAYTAGLFVGVPLAITFVLYIDSLGNGALPGALLFLALLVAGTEIAQWALLRSRFWGPGESGPFYALGYRAAIGGIVALALVSQYFSVASVAADGIALVVLQSVAVVVLEVAGALLSVRARPGSGRTGGGPLSGAIFGAVGFFLIGIGSVAGEAGAFAGAVIALVGGVWVYRRLRPLLSAIPPPSAGPPAPPRGVPASYGRTHSAPSDAPLRPGGGPGTPPAG